MACDNKASGIYDPEKPGNYPADSIRWINDMANDFADIWTKEEDGGQWFHDAERGINWADVHNTDSSQKGRVEVFRPWVMFQGEDIVHTIKGKFTMDEIASGQENQGGWVMQTMAWNITNLAGNREYKPLIVARIRANQVDYLVYDFEWNPARQRFTSKPGFPVSMVLETGPQTGKTHDITLQIKFSRTETGFVRATLNGERIHEADYNGVTYPSAIPYMNQRIFWKAGCYASYEGIHYGRIGIHYLATDVP